MKALFDFISKLGPTFPTLVAALPWALCLGLVLSATCSIMNAVPLPILGESPPPSLLGLLGICVVIQRAR